MSIRRLKTLIAIAETGSFAGAAERVCLTPAAVGQQVRALERELGVALFERHRRSPQLSRLGRALVPKARAVVESYDRLVPSLTDSDGPQELVIGAVPTTMTGLVPGMLAALRGTHAGLHVRVVPGLSADLMPQVERGLMDAAIVSQPGQSYDHLEWRVFAEEPLMVLAPLGAPGDDPFSLLEGFPFIRFNRRAWVGRQIDEWLRLRKPRIRESMELDTLESISAMVFHGLGVSIVPGRCVPSPRPLPLKRVALDPSAPPRRLGLLWRRDDANPQLLDLILAELVGVVRAAEIAASGPPEDDKAHL